MKAINADALKELSADWFEVQKNTFYPGKDATDAERRIYFIGQNYLRLLEQVTSVPPMVDEVEILKHYTYDPQCRSRCSRGRFGINRIPDKKGGSFYQLQLCHCAKPIENEYAKLERLFIEQMKSFSNLQGLHTNAILNYAKTMEEQNKIQKENVNLLDRSLTQIDRHTFGYWMAKVIKFFSLKEEHADTVSEAIHRPAEQG